VLLKVRSIPRLLLVAILFLAPSVSFAAGADPVLADAGMAVRKSDGSIDVPATIGALQRE
jgi:hypothetical protein